MQSFLKIALFSLFALGSLLPQIATAQQRKFIAVVNLPVSVRSSADQALANVDWLIAVQDNEGWYAILGKDEQKRLVEYRCNPEGSSGYFRIQIQP